METLAKATSRWRADMTTAKACFLPSSFPLTTKGWLSIGEKLLVMPSVLGSDGEARITSFSVLKIASVFLLFDWKILLKLFSFLLKLQVTFKSTKIGVKCQNWKNATF